MRPNDKNPRPLSPRLAAIGPFLHSAALSHCGNPLGSQDRQEIGWGVVISLSTSAFYYPRLLRLVFYDRGSARGLRSRARELYGRAVYRRKSLPGKKVAVYVCVYIPRRFPFIGPFLRWQQQSRVSEERKREKGRKVRRAHTLALKSFAERERQRENLPFFRAVIWTNARAFLVVRASFTTHSGRTGAPRVYYTRASVSTARLPIRWRGTSRLADLLFLDFFYCTRTRIYTHRGECACVQFSEQYPLLLPSTAASTVFFSSSSYARHMSEW